MMRYCGTFVLLCSFLLCLTFTGFSQESSPPPAGGNETPRGQGGEFMQHMQKELGLSDAQMGKMKEIEQQRISQMRENTKEFSGQIKSVLNADQQAQWEKKRAEWESSEMGAGGSHGSGGGQMGQGEFFKNFNLNQDQKTKVMGIMKEQQARMKAERETFDGEVSKILTPEQLAKYKTMREKMTKFSTVRENMKERRQGGGGRKQQP
jgi:Spy/CpxP family protein refolding chaperone